MMEHESGQVERERHDREIAEANKRRQARQGIVPVESEETPAEETPTEEVPSPKPE
jgi:hypothetical protein